MRDVIGRVADRLLHTTSMRALPAVRPEVLDGHERAPAVDLLVGTVLFRREFLSRRRHGHVDLPRAVEAGLGLAGLTVVTRFPDLRGTLSLPHFWSLGLPVHRLRSDMDIAGAFVRRIEGWADASAGRFHLVRTARELDALPHGTLGGFIGVQGGHVLDGDPGNVEPLHRLGVRMLALAHVMDNALVGSNTGARRGGLTALGREVVVEMERVGMVVDLAHMSIEGIATTVPHLTRPFLLSHTGFTAVNGRRSWRRFSPANRNVPDASVRLVAEAGGVVGVTFSTVLLGGAGPDAVRRSFEHALETAGPEHVAIGSDFDGALRMTWDVRGLPVLRELLVDSGLPPVHVDGVMRENALRVLRAVFPER